MNNNKDLNIVRELAKKKAEISQLSVQAENKKLWADVNDLKQSKPAIYINEIPWHEMNYNDELTIQSTNPFLKGLEEQLRKEIYCFKYLPGNMVIEPVIYSPLICHDTGFGISEDVDIKQTDKKSGVVSRNFHIQIKNEDDIEKIKYCKITYDKAKTEETFQKMKYIFDGIIDVKKKGCAGFWFSPWDNLIRYTGVTEGLMDLALRPEYIHKLVERYVSVYLDRLNQMEKLGLLASNNNNMRVGSGGYGYCSDLPDAESNLENTPTDRIWGCATDQIFSDISPQMHYEFGLKHEMKVLKKFGLTYYGCCEPLDKKVDVFSKIPNLRKVSMSPWADLDIAVPQIQNKYVLSCKPNPAVFATEKWHKEVAKEDIKKILDKTKGCSLEIIMKDISTVRYEPQRLWEWSAIAQELVNQAY